MPKRTAGERERDRASIARWYLEGKTQRQMGQLLGIHQRQVWREIEKIRAVWRESTTYDFAEAINRELAKLDKIEADAWTQFEASGKPEIQTVIVTEGKAKKRTRRRTVRTPDPRWIAIVLQCIERRIKILGLEQINASQLRDLMADLGYDVGLDEQAGLDRFLALCERVGTRGGDEAPPGSAPGSPTLQ